MMLYAVNLPVLLRRLVVGWESQIADVRRDLSTARRQTACLQCNQQIVIRHNADGTLQIVPEDADAVDFEALDLSEADFWQLLFGEIGWDQVRPDASVSPEISAFLETLFPKRDVIFWVPDQY